MSIDIIKEDILKLINTKAGIKYILTNDFNNYCLKNELNEELIDEITIYLSDNNVTIIDASLIEDNEQLDLRTLLLNDISKTKLYTEKEEQEKEQQLMSIKNSISYLEEILDNEEDNEKKANIEAQLFNLNKEYKDFRKEFMTHHLRLVVSIATREYHKVNMNKVSFNDIVNDGTIGLSKAIDKYDANRGVKFSYYATYWIKQTIGRSLAEKTDLIRLPQNRVAQQRIILDTIQKFIVENNREPSNEELSKILHYSKDLINLLRNKSTVITSLDTPLTDEENSSFYDVIPDDSESFSDNYEMKSSLKKAMDIVNEVLNSYSKNIVMDENYSILDIAIDILVSKITEDIDKNLLLNVFSLKYNLTIGQIEKLSKKLSSIVDKGKMKDIKEVSSSIQYKDILPYLEDYYKDNKKININNRLELSKMIFESGLTRKEANEKYGFSDKEYYSSLRVVNRIKTELIKKVITNVSRELLSKDFSEEKVINIVRTKYDVEKLIYFASKGFYFGEPISITNIARILNTTKQNVEQNLSIVNRRISIEFKKKGYSNYSNFIEGNSESIESLEKKEIKKYKKSGSYVIDTKDGSIRIYGPLYDEKEPFYYEYNGYETKYIKHLISKLKNMDQFELEKMLKGTQSFKI